MGVLACLALGLALVGPTAPRVLAQTPGATPAATTPAAGSDAPAPPSAAPAAQPAPPAPDRVAEGTLVVIELAEPVSSKTIKRGDMFKIRLAAPVMLGERTVIAAGAPGMGQVVDAAPAGMLGKPAKLLLAARYLEVDGVRIPLRAMKLGRAGTDKTDVILAVNMVPYVGILADFMRGGEIEIPAGTLATAKLGADVDAPPAAGLASPPAATAPTTEPGTHP